MRTRVASSTIEGSSSMVVIEPEASSTTGRHAPLGARSARKFVRTGQDRVACKDARACRPSPMPASSGPPPGSTSTPPATACRRATASRRCRRRWPTGAAGARAGSTGARAPRAPGRRGRRWSASAPERVAIGATVSAFAGLIAASLPDGANVRRARRRVHLDAVSLPRPGAARGYGEDRGGRAARRVDRRHHRRRRLQRRADEHRRGRRPRRDRRRRRAPRRADAARRDAGLRLAADRRDALRRRHLPPATSG